MIWFEYKYTTSSEIINNIKLLTEYTILEYSVLAGLLILIIISIYFIIPTLNIIRKYKSKEKEKNKKAELLRLIVIQANINEEIEKELDIH